MFSTPLESMSEYAQLVLRNPGFYRSDDQAYSEQQKHAQAIDHFLGFEVLEIESKLSGHDYKDYEAWIGLNPRQLQTPYDELLLMTQFLQLREDEHVVDLGAGYGRLGMVLHQQTPEVQFTGYELVNERVENGNQIFTKFGIANAQLHQQDLLGDDFNLNDADVFFLYDYGQKEHLKHTLDQIEQHSYHHEFRLVARGRGVRSLIQHQYPRLCHAVDPTHFETFSVYSTP